MATHGTSKFVAPVDGGKVLAEAEFMDFSPAPISCLNCIVPPSQKARTFLRAYDNRLEMNTVKAPCVCFFDDEMYMKDAPTMMFFDKPPFRSGLCEPCFCIPCTCCGPPVLFAHKPACGPISLVPCYGEQIKKAPANLFGLKTYIIFGNPCYVSTAVPFMSGLKNADKFLADMANVTTAYQDKMGIPKDQGAYRRSMRYGTCTGTVDLPRYVLLYGATIHSA